MIPVCEEEEAQRKNNERVSISKVIPHFLAYNETIPCTQYVNTATSQGLS